MQVPEIHLQPHVSSGIKKLAQFGHIAKGVVYILAGTLTAMAAFGLGGAKSDQKDVFVFVKELPFGKVLLMLIAAGLLSFVIWRLVQAFKDPGHEHKKNEAKRIGARLGYAWSGLVYAGLAFAAAKIAMGQGRGQGSKDAKQDSLVAKVMDLPMGEILLYLVAAGLVIFGLYQIYRAVSGKFMKNIKQTSMDPDKQKIYKRAGQVGYIARGIMFGIIGFLFYKAVTTARSVKSADTEGAFNYMETIPYGSLLLGLVALGLVGYGIFMFVRAKYYAVPV